LDFVHWTKSVIGLYPLVFLTPAVIAASVFYALGVILWHLH